LSWQGQLQEAKTGTVADQPPLFMAVIALLSIHRIVVANIYRNNFRYRNKPRPPGCQRIAGQALKRFWCSKQKT